MENRKTSTWNRLDFANTTRILTDRALKNLPDTAEDMRQGILIEAHSWTHRGHQINR